MEIVLLNDNFLRFSVTEKMLPLFDKCHFQPLV